MSTPTPPEVLHLLGVLTEHADCTLNDSTDLGAVVTAEDVWSCGLRLPFSEDLDVASRLHLAHALAKTARARALSDLKHQWQWGAWAKVLKPPAPGGLRMLAHAQQVTDWLRDQALEAGATDV